MKKNLFLGLIALTVTSCQNDEVVEAVPQKQTIEFGTYLGRDAQARAAELTTDMLKEKGFGVFAYYTGTKDWGDAKTNATPNFMYNQEVAWDASAWGYSPIKYWPEQQTEYISFFAYGPFNNNQDTPSATITTMSAANSTGIPTVTFTQANDVTKMVDFVAGVAMNQTYSPEGNDDSKTVSFNLKHELTRVNFAAKLDRDAYSDSEEKLKTRVVVKSININSGGKFYQSAVYTFAENNDVTGNSPQVYRGCWSNHNSNTIELDLDGILAKETLTVPSGGASPYYSESGIILTDDEEKNMFTTISSVQYLFLIPPVQNDGTTGLAFGDEIKVTFEYDIVTLDNALATRHSATSATKIVTLPTGDANAIPVVENTLQQGKAYKFIFTFGLHEVKVIAEVDNWDNDQDGGDTEVDWNDNQPN